MSASLQDSLTLPIQLLTTTKPPVTCPDCGTRFSRQSDLNRHITPKVDCPVGGCPKEFRMDKDIDYKRHLIKEHPGLDYQRGMKFFKDRKGVSEPFPSLCAPGGSQRTVAEPQLIQASAQQPRFSATPGHDGSLGGVTLKNDPSISSDTYHEAIQPWESYGPSMWQDTMPAEPSSDNAGPNLGGPMFDP